MGNTNVVCSHGTRFKDNDILNINLLAVQSKSWGQFALLFTI